MHKVSKSSKHNSRQYNKRRSCRLYNLFLAIIKHLKPKSLTKVIIHLQYESKRYGPPNEGSICQEGQLTVSHLVLLISFEAGEGVVGDEDSKGSSDDNDEHFGNKEDPADGFREKVVNTGDSEVSENGRLSDVTQGLEENGGGVFTLRRKVVKSVMS